MKVHHCPMCNQPARKCDSCESTLHEGPEGGICTRCKKTYISLSTENLHALISVQSHLYIASKTLLDIISSMPGLKESPKEKP